MKKEELDKLLEKYYSGKTDTFEEKRLKEYFSGEIIYPGYESEKNIFRHYQSSDKIPVPSDDFEDRIVSAIDNLEKKRKRNSLRLRTVSAISGIAAAVILVLSYFLFIKDEELIDTYSDPRIAYTETMKILYEVSVKLNKGTEALEELGKMQGAMEKGLESVDRSASIISANLRQSRLFAEEKEYVND